jgi:hypothetical protein
MSKVPSGVKTLLTVFHERVGAELIQGTENITETQVRFLMRVPKGPPTTRWLSIIDRMIDLGDQQLATKAPEWTLDISKQYFRRPELRYGWRFIFQGKELAKWLPQIADSIKKMPIRAQQIEEVRLNGSPNRRVGGYYGQVPVGPLALTQR